MNQRTKLELTWIGKENRPRLEPRILLEEPGRSYHAKRRVTENDLFDNRLIFGDNLLALKALEQEFSGRIKCIFIDPPYNTGAAFQHYDDGIEHSIWLGMIRDRLELLRSLLTEDGAFWLTLDDTEAHYFKVMADEVFGRPNFVANVIWEKADSPRMDARYFSSRHDHLLVYAKRMEAFQLNRVLVEGKEAPKHYSKVDKDGRRYYLKPLRAMGADGTREARPSLYFPLTAPDGKQVFPKNPDGSDSRWRWGIDRVSSEGSRIEWVTGRSGWSAYFRIYADENEERPPETIWTHQEVGSNRTAKAEAKALVTGHRPFETPKPEKLLRRILSISTAPGDWVLDSFAGSGTSGAVAHKMGRRWIMVELGEHCHTHIIPRLKKVIDGGDPGGVTEATRWKGGGGFQYFRIAPSLLEKDRWENWIVSKQYNAAMLAEALCKLEGFTYAPSDSVYWQHGRSTERDFIYVTTQKLTHAQLAALSEEIGENHALLVYCMAFRAKAGSFPNLTIKKIPTAVLHRCEWGKDDYSLEVARLPAVVPEPGQQPLFKARS
jgi:adenine-specific DNA-methyltransferase